MNRILDHLLMEEEAQTSRLLSFLCIYPFQGENHNLVIYAHNWAEAHSYAQYHGLIVKEKVKTPCYR